MHSKNHRRRLTALALSVAAVPASAAIIGAGTAGAAGAVPVKALDNVFAPKKVTIRKGTSVKWTNAGKVAHNVKGSGFASPTLKPGGVYKFRFSRVGVFKYVCTIHAPAMKGTVTVTK